MYKLHLTKHPIHKHFSLYYSGVSGNIKFQYGLQQTVTMKLILMVWAKPPFKNYYKKHITLTVIFLYKLNLSQSLSL